MLVIWMRKIGRCFINLIGIIVIAVVIILIGRRVRMRIKGIIWIQKIKIIIILKDKIKKGEVNKYNKVMK